MTSQTRTRLTAAERSEQLIRAAVKAFATSGYAGTTTDDIARLAGVSQPYVIRLFRSKQHLFIAAMQHACGRIEEVFREAAGDAGHAELMDLATRYKALLDEPELLGVLLHGYAAAGVHPEIGAVVRERYGRLWTLIGELTGAPLEDRRNFMAIGMLITVLSAMRVIGPDAVEHQPWMTELLSSFTLVEVK
jgi:AcrR family transcriptional regulator